MHAVLVGSPDTEQVVYRLALLPSVIDRQGCFTLEFIPAGAAIRAYEGEHIDAAEARRREHDPSRPAIYTFWIDAERVIDGWFGGNESIYINHSCAPNCWCDRQEDTIWIRAARDIRPGEELTIDYAYDPQTPLEPCRCGMPDCRGYLNEIAP